MSALEPDDLQKQLSSEPKPKHNRKGWLTQTSLKWGFTETFPVGTYVVTLGRSKDGAFYTVVVRKGRWGETNLEYQAIRKYLSARHRFVLLTEKYSKKVAMETLGIET